MDSVLFPKDSKKSKLTKKLARHKTWNYVMIVIIVILSLVAVTGVSLSVYFGIKWRQDRVKN